MGVVLVSAIAIGGLQIAGANPQGPGSYGPGHRYEQQGRRSLQQCNAAFIKAQNKFLDTTVSIRKAMTTKRAEMRAIMKNAAPNAEQAARLSGELFDLREQLRAKAQENGLNVSALRGLMGMGRHGNYGPGCGGRFQNQMM